MLRTVETSWISLQLFIIRRTSALVIVRTLLWTISFTFPHGSAVANRVEGKQYTRRDPVAYPSTLLRINLEQQTCPFEQKTISTSSVVCFAGDGQVDEIGRTN